MDSMEVNKGIAAVLVAGITFFLAGTIGANLVTETKPAKTAIAIATPEPSTGGKPAGPAPLPAVGPLLAKADIAAGEAYVKKVCTACHTFDEGGKAGVGPNLYGILGSIHGHMAGFNYSNAIKEKKGPWTYDELNEWLDKPSAYAPGTRMAFPGIKDNQERANVIDYLHSLSHNPEPLPPATAPAPAPAPSGGGTAAPASSSQAQPSVDSLLASANPAAGEADAKKLGCNTCHTFTEGGKPGLGPNLYGVVGGPQAHEEGFNYSPALKGKGGKWNYEELDKWLTKPSAYAPGTRMTFTGIKDPKERADVIDYLRSLSHNPEPLPAKP